MSSCDPTGDKIRCTMGMREKLSSSDLDGLSLPSGAVSKEGKNLARWILELKRFSLCAVEASIVLMLAGTSRS